MASLSLKRPGRGATCDGPRRGGVNSWIGIGDDAAQRANRRPGHPDFWRMSLREQNNQPLCGIRARREYWLDKLVGW